MLMWRVANEKTRWQEARYTFTVSNIPGRQSDRMHGNTKSFPMSAAVGTRSRHGHTAWLATRSYDREYCQLVTQHAVYGLPPTDTSFRAFELYPLRTPAHFDCGQSYTLVER